MTTLSATNVQVCQIQNQYIPDEGPKSIPYNLDFTAEVSYLYDGTLQQNMKYISMVQTLWYSTAGMGGGVQVDIPGSQQQIILPVDTQGYINLLCPNPSKIQFTSLAGLGAGSLRLQLINVPIASFVMSTI